MIKNDNHPAVAIDDDDDWFDHLTAEVLYDQNDNDNNDDDEDDYDCYDDHLTAEVLYEGQRLPPLVAHQAHCALVNHWRKIMIKMKIINYQRLSL